MTNPNFANDVIERALTRLGIPLDGTQGTDKHQVDIVFIMTILTIVRESNRNMDGERQAEILHVLADASQEIAIRAKEVAQATFNKHKNN